VESRHAGDAGDSENIFNLSEDELVQRRIVWVDIAADKVNDIKPNREPANFYSQKTGRGRLAGEWWKDHDPIMCCYKLVTIKFQVFGLQTRIEDIIMRVCNASVHPCLILLSLVESKRIADKISQGGILLH
jgi:hypothetical protein